MLTVVHDLDTLYIEGRAYLEILVEDVKGAFDGI